MCKNGSVRRNKEYIVTAFIRCLNKLYKVIHIHIKTRNTDCFTILKNRSCKGNTYSAGLFINIRLGDLEPGKWRYLTADEKKELLKGLSK